MKGIVCVDTSPVMDKVWAKKAGLGWIGKHTNLITRDFGSWIFLGELILDIDLEFDSSFKEDLCGSCTACIEACPTQALDEYKINSNKCISYLTIEHRESFLMNNLNFMIGYMGVIFAKMFVHGMKNFQEIQTLNHFFREKK